MTRRYVMAGVLTVVIVVGAMAISSRNDDDDRASVAVPDSTAVTAPSTPSTSSTSSTTTTTRGQRGNGNAVTFAFAGDVNFPEAWDTEDGPPPNAPPLAEQVRADPHHVLDAIAPVLSDADLAMVNVETAITDGGDPVAGKNYHFRSPAQTFQALKSAGVDVVNMANNHSLDYGPSGIEDTFAAIDAAKVAVSGLGHDADQAYRPYRTTIKGQRIAIVSASDWLEPALVDSWSATDAQPGIAFSIDRTRLLAEVQKVRSEVDTLVVFLHWGTEETWCASGEQQDLASALLGAGADIIVGSHAHRVFGAGKVGPALVAYGMGNFVYWREDGESGRSGVLKVTATGRDVDDYSWVPARITNGVPVPQTGAAADADLAEWNARRACSGLGP
ncbi:MAG TPA: CapA family protein [Acidimicrobiia bacterium]|nr:CapA family protein [Acidimicrobiia bacterium]